MMLCCNVVLFWVFANFLYNMLHIIEAFGYQEELDRVELLANGSTEAYCVVWISLSRKN